MKPKRRSVEKGTWTVGVDDKEVPVTGKKVVVVGRDGMVKRSKFSAKGELPDGTKMKIKDKTRFR